MSSTTPMPTPKPSPGTPSNDAYVSVDAQNAAGGVPQGATGTKVGLDGRPVGSPIVTGKSTVQIGSNLGPNSYVSSDYVQSTVVTKKTQYTSTSAMETFANLGNQEKAELLSKLAQIPGIYRAGQAPTQTQILTFATSGSVVPRQEDIDALTKVMTYSDRVGEGYKDSVNKFFYDKNLAAQYFGTGGAKSGPSVTPSDALIAEIRTNFLDVFNEAPDKKTAAAYAKEVQQLEIKQKC